MRAGQSESSEHPWKTYYGRNRGGAVSCHSGCRWRLMDVPWRLFFFFVLLRYLGQCHPCRLRAELQERAQVHCFRHVLGGGRSRSSLQLLLLRMPLCILKAECLVLLVQIIEIFFPVTLTHTSLYICSQSNPEPRFLVQIETSMALVSLWQSSAPHRLRMSWLAIEKPLGFPL